MWKLSLWLRKMGRYRTSKGHTDEIGVETREVVETRVGELEKEVKELKAEARIRARPETLKDIKNIETSETGEGREEEEEREEEVEEKGEEEGKSDLLPILHYIYEPTRRQLMGLTNVGIAQVNNLVWMAVFDAETEQMCQYLDYKKNIKNWEEGKPFPRMPEQVSLSAIWSEVYSWLRRSVDGLGLMQAAQLATRQMETQEMGEERPDLIDGR